MEPHGLLSLAAAPVGSGRAWPGFEMTRRSPAAWRAPVEAHGLLSLAAAPVGGGRAWPGFEIDHFEPLGSRVAISRAGRRPQAPIIRTAADSSDYSPARRSTSWMMRPQMALTHAIAATPRTRERQGRISRKYSKP